jgi:hypothetical protein
MNRSLKQFLVWASLVSVLLNPAMAMATADNQTLQAPSDVGSVLKGSVWYDPSTLVALALLVVVTAAFLV